MRETRLERNAVSIDENCSILSDNTKASLNRRFSSDDLEPLRSRKRDSLCSEEKSMEKFSSRRSVKELHSKLKEADNNLSVLYKLLQKEKQKSLQLQYVEDDLQLMKKQHLEMKANVIDQQSKNDLLQTENLKLKQKVEQLEYKQKTVSEEFSKSKTVLTNVSQCLESLKNKHLDTVKRYGHNDVLRYKMIRVAFYLFSKSCHNRVMRRAMYKWFMKAKYLKAIEGYHLKTKTFERFRTFAMCKTERKSLYHERNSIDERMAQIKLDLNLDAEAKIAAATGKMLIEREKERMNIHEFYEESYRKLEIEREKLQALERSTSKSKNDLINLNKIHLENKKSLEKYEAKLLETSARMRNIADDRNQELDERNDSLVKREQDLLSREKQTAIKEKKINQVYKAKNIDAIEVKSKELEGYSKQLDEKEAGIIAKQGELCRKLADFELKQKLLRDKEMNIEMQEGKYNKLIEAVQRKQKKLDALYRHYEELNRELENEYEAVELLNNTLNENYHFYDINNTSVIVTSDDASSVYEEGRVKSDSFHILDNNLLKGCIHVDDYAIEVNRIVQVASLPSNSIKSSPPMQVSRLRDFMSDASSIFSIEESKDDHTS